MPKKRRSLVKGSSAKRSSVKKPSIKKVATLRKIRKKIETKIKDYKRLNKKTKKKKKKKKVTVKVDKGGLKLLSKLKKFLRVPTGNHNTHQPSVNQLARMTIKGPEDVKLLEDVVDKMHAIEEAAQAEREYYDNQPYCNNCNDVSGGCVMCNQY